MDANDDDVWGDLFFPGLSRTAQRFWLRFEEVADETHTVVSFFNYFISFLGVILNLIHFIILTRRSMMTSSTNIITIGICVCDFIMTANWCQTYISIKMSMNRFASPHVKCIPPQDLFLAYIDAVLSSGSFAFRRCAVWLGVLLAAVRTLVIKDPTHSRASTLMTLKFGFLATVSTLLISAPLLFLQLRPRRITVLSVWTPGPKCSDFPDNFTQPELAFLSDDSFYDSDTHNLLVSLDSWMYRIIPSILLPVFTVVLLIELRRARIRRSRLGNSEDTTGDKTTRFVLYMTVSFVFAAAPQGIIALLLIIAIGHQGFVNILNQLIAIFLAADTVNSITHIFICFFMSSQYQKTVKKMLRIKEPVVAPMSLNSTTQQNKTVANV